MALDQNIRFSAYGGLNNPEGLYDYVKPTRKIKGEGPPGISQGENNWDYIDVLTGIEYIKNNGVWEPYVNFSSFAPTVIPDPLSIDQLNVNTVRGNANDNVEVDLGAAGDINLTSGGTHGININSGNVFIQGNGFATFQSGTRQYNVLVDDFAGKQMTLETVPDYKLSVTGSTGDIILDAGANSVKLASDLDTNGKRITNTAAGEELVIENQASIRLISEGPLLLNTTTSQNINTGSGNIVMANGEIQRCSAVRNLVGAMTISNGAISENLILQTNGTSEVSIINGINNISLNADTETITTKKIDIDEINDSVALVDNSILNVNTSGVLSWRKYPRCFELIQSGFGNNGTSYFNLGNSTVGPGEFWATCTGNGRNLAEVDYRIISNSAWNLGGVGAAVLEVGYIQNNLPVIGGNFVVLRTININNTADIYGASLTGFNDSIPALAAIAARTVLIGTSATASNVEITLNLTLV